MLGVNCRIIHELPPMWSGVAKGQLRIALLSLTPTATPDLRLAWEAAAVGVLPDNSPSTARDLQLGVQQYLIRITCCGDKHQRELIERFQAEGLDFLKSSGWAPHRSNLNIDNRQDAAGAVQPVLPSKRIMTASPPHPAGVLTWGTMLVNL